MAVFLQDTFTHADGNLSGTTATPTGGTWGATGNAGDGGGPLLIVSNSVQNATADGSHNAGLVNSAVPGSANYDVEAVWTITSNKAALWMRARWVNSAGDKGDCYEVYTDSANLYVFAKYNGAGGGADFVELGHVAWSVGSSATTILLRVVGDQISVYVNGVGTLGPYTDSNVTAAGKVAIGVDCYLSGGENGGIIDTLVCTDSTSGTDTGLWLIGA
jgi:hypothetical protein